MKATAIDYLLSTIATAFAISASALVVWLTHSIWLSSLAQYHVLWEILLFLLLFGVWAAVLVRLVIWAFPIGTGEYGPDAREFVVWKLISIVYRLGQGALKPFTTVFTRPLIEVMFGARIGSDVALGGAIDDPYQITLGNRVVLGHNSLVTGNYLNHGTLVCGQVKIGDGATVGANCVVLPGSELGENSVLIAGSYLMPGTLVPAGEIWRGNPARKWM